MRLQFLDVDGRSVDREIIRERSGFTENTGEITDIEIEECRRYDSDLRIPSVVFLEWGLPAVVNDGLFPAPEVGRQPPD